jgi:hypothetical protein
VEAEAQRAVWEAMGTQRKRAEVPQRVQLPQLEGCRPIDCTLVPPLPTDCLLRVLELFAGVGAATQAVVRLGYAVGEVVACERRGAARQAHARSIQQLRKEFPTLVMGRAGAQVHHRLPQDIRLVTAEQLESLGPIDLVVAGWPCQGNNAAGKGRGLDDDRLGLFTELLRVLEVLQELHKRWGRKLAYVIEHVVAGFDRRPKVREHYAAVWGLLGLEVVFDAAQVGSLAHRLRAWWTNLEGTPLKRPAITVQKRPAGLFVHQALRRGRQAKPPRTTGTAPWACVTVGRVSTARLLGMCGNHG